GGGGAGGGGAGGRLEPPTLKAAARPGRPAWGRWAVAAGLLLAAGGLSALYWNAHQTGHGNVIADATTDAADDGPGRARPATVEGGNSDPHAQTGWGP